MLRIQLMLQWYSLGDPAMEVTLIKVPTKLRSAVIKLVSDNHKKTTILTLRYLLNKQSLSDPYQPASGQCSPISLLFSSPLGL